MGGIWCEWGGERLWMDDKMGDDVNGVSALYILSQETRLYYVTRMGKHNLIRNT